MFSISCAWNSKRHTNALSMVQELKSLGFNKIELNFALTNEFVCDIISIRDVKYIEVTSVHNFCPVPEEIPLKNASPDYYSLASLDEKERKLAIQATKNTILTAQRLHAPYAILHLGRVKMEDRTKELAGVLNKTREYTKLKNEMTEKRAETAGLHVDRAIDSLWELSKFAEDADVVLGIETRYYHNEIPSMDEMGVILNTFNNKSVGYWHDIGHAQLFENLGLCGHSEYLEKYKNRLIGMHLHDIKGIKNHLAPLQGEFDFSMLRPYINKNTVLVLEPHQPASAEDIKKGLKHLEDVFKTKTKN